MAFIARKIIIGSDHAGFELKQGLMPFLQKQDITLVDMGPPTTASCAYAEYAKLVCDRVLQESGTLGILICGTGIGMSIAANRFQGIRAALCTHEFHARLTRMHNDANVLCLGSRVTALALAQELAVLFCSTAFEGGRHAQRIALLDEL